MEQFLVDEVIREVNEPRGWGGRKFVVTQNERDYTVSIYSRSHIGTAFSDDGMGWSGMTFMPLTLEELDNVHLLLGEALAKAKLAEAETEGRG